MATTTKIINVLRPDVYQECHIPGTINVPLSELENYVQQFPKDTALIVYCAHYECPLSKKAWHLLYNFGYTNVKAYEGGIAEWSQMGLPTQGVCKLEYLKEKHAPQEDSTVQTISLEHLKKLLNL